MKIRVLLFAALRQAAAEGVLHVQLPAGATIGDLRRRLQEEFPEMSTLLKQAAFAVNANYSDDSATIPTDAEVACIPPVSGG